MPRGAHRIETQKVTRTLVGDGLPHPSAAGTSKRDLRCVTHCPNPEPSCCAPLHSLKETEMLPAKGGNFPSTPGVYAVYDAAGALQYVGLSRKVSASVAAHLQDLPGERTGDCFW
jgi:hypothetical protein